MSPEQRLADLGIELPEPLQLPNGLAVEVEAAVTL
jgi:hypothetical protein